MAWITLSEEDVQGRLAGAELTALKSSALASGKTAAEVLAFRDVAFMKYFSRHEYELMVRQKFGPHAAADVTRMLALGRLKRKLLGD